MTVACEFVHFYSIDLPDRVALAGSDFPLAQLTALAIRRETSTAQAPCSPSTELSLEEKAAAAQRGLRNAVPAFTDNGVNKP